MPKKTIFLTGSTGFLGKEIIPILLEKDYNVKALTRNISGYKNTSDITFVEGNILDRDLIAREMKGCYGLIHVAGEKNDISKMQSVNVDGTKVICDVALKSNLKYFCQVSSVGVIGLTDKKFVDENTVCNPINTYEKTKLEAENYVLNNFNVLDCNSIIIRPTNVFGNPQLKFSDSVFSKIKRWMKGNEVANYIYVKNVAKACVYFLTQSKTYKNEIFTINDVSKNNRFKNIFSMVIRKKEFWFYAPIVMPWFLRVFKFGKNNLGDKVYCNKKILASGFKFPFTLEESIKDALK